MNFYTTIATQGKANLATSGYSSQMAEIDYVHNTEAFYIKWDSPLVTKNIHINPRISLLLNNQEINMAGILHPIDEVPENLEQIITVKEEWYQLKPYYFKDKEKILERRKEGWVPAKEPVTQLWFTLPLKDQWNFWKNATRSISLPLSFYPILIGGLLALGSWENLTFQSIALLLCALVGGISGHFGTNLISDYYDYIRGVDTPDALSSHVSVLVDQRMSPDNALLGALLAFTLTGFTGGYLVTIAGFPVIIVGLLGLVGGYAYTGGIFGLKYKGFGEVLVFLLMGPLMMIGTYYVITLSISIPVILLSCAAGLLVASATLSNNLRDMLYDTEAGYKTLPLRIGIENAKKLYFIMVYVPYVLVAFLMFFHIKFGILLLVLISIPKANKSYKAIAETESTPLAFYKGAPKYIYPLNAILQHASFCKWLTIGMIIILFL